jgi:hypothetical protein
MIHETGQILKVSPELIEFSGRAVYSDALLYFDALTVTDTGDGTPALVVGVYAQRSVHRRSAGNAATNEPCSSNGDKHAIKGSSRKAKANDNPSGNRRDPALGQADVRFLAGWKYLFLGSNTLAACDGSSFNHDSASLNWL